MPDTEDESKLPPGKANRVFPLDPSYLVAETDKKKYSRCYALPINNI